MRFNVLAIGGKHTKMVGKKTDYRVLNHIRSLQGCCKVLQGKKQPNKLPEKSQTTRKRGGEQLKLILWHPGQQRKIMVGDQDVCAHRDCKPSLVRNFFRPFTSSEKKTRRYNRRSTTADTP